MMNTRTINKKKVTLSRCTIIGNENCISGFSNNITGNNNYIDGDDNTITGDNNVIKGEYNKVIGKNNRSTYSISSSGNLGWGSETQNRDTFLYRNSNNTLNLRTDGLETRSPTRENIPEKKPIKKIKKILDTTEETENNENISDELLCVVCRDKLKKVVSSPCGHKALCIGCANSLISPDETKIKEKCPICRTKIKKFIRIFD